MADADRDKMLREMAENRGCKLTKSRRRKPGGDFGRYGLKDAKTGKEVFGFGEDGFTASAEDIESYLRGSTIATWKRSLISSVDTAEPAAKAPKKSRAKAEPAPPPPPPPPPPPKKEPEPAPKPPPLVIREAKLGDAEAIAALLAEIEAEVGASDVAATLKLLKSTGEPPLVAEQGEVVGCVTWHAAAELHRADPVGRIPILIVAPEARKRGIGRALLEAAEARLSERGCTSVEATTSLKMSGALAFYQAAGFERTGFHLRRTLDD